MNSAETSLRATVVEFCRLGRQLPDEPAHAYHQVAAGIHQLGVAIQQSESAELSRTTIKEILSPAIELHADSPLIRRLQTWPRGYPGDFETIEYLCSARNGAEPGSLGFYIEQVAQQSSVTQQHRNKVAWQASRMLETSLLGAQEKRVLSIACGGSRDLRSISALLCDSNVSIFLNDMDAEALECSRHNLPDLSPKLTLITDNVFKATRKFAQHAPFDLIVAGGLFDYLTDEQLIWLLPKLFDCLRDAGSLCFTNLIRGNPARSWMEYLCNWQIIERSEDDIQRLLQAATLDQYVNSIERDTTGLALLVRVLKVLRRDQDGFGAPQSKASTSADAPRQTSNRPPSISVVEGKHAANDLLVPMFRDFQRKVTRYSDLIPVEDFASSAWDNQGVFLVAAREGQPLAALRTNLASDLTVDEEMSRGFGFDSSLRNVPRQAITVTTAPCLMPRASPRAIESLYASHFQRLADAGVQMDLIAVRPAQISQLERFGYRRYKCNFVRQSSPLRVPMGFDIAGSPYGAAVGMPLPEQQVICRPENRAPIGATGPESNQAWSNLLSSPGLTDLFAHLSPDDARLFLTDCSVHSFAAEEVIIRAGDSSSEMFVILSGTVKVFDANSTTVAIRSMGPRECFGEIGVLSDNPRSATVRASTDVIAIVIDANQIIESSTIMPRVAAQVLLNLCKSVCKRVSDDSDAKSREIL